MSSYDDRRRDSSRRESSSRDRRRSPGPSRDRSPPKPRDENELPSEFGRGIEDFPDDDNNVLQKMKSSFKTSPLGCIYKCIDGSRKLKVWTRNFKEVRGILSGYVVAFDKHWNLIMSDVDEVYLKPRRAKTPFLTKIDPKSPLNELPDKVPKKKKTAEEKAAFEEAEKAAAAERAAKAEEAKAAAEKDGTKLKTKRRRKKNKGPITGTRNIPQMFVRGDNIVMVSILDNESEHSDEE